MTTKFMMTDVVKKIEHKYARRWLQGAGEHAVFEVDSHGWWATFESSPASMYLGETEPKLVVGDRVQLTLEKV